MNTSVRQLDLIEARGLEVRYFDSTIHGPLETRENDDGTVGFVGYASVFDVWYDVAGGPERGGWREMIAAGAATRTLNAKPDVRLLVNHAGLPLARTKSKTLRLDQDERGLIADAASLDTKNPTVQEVVSGMSRGDVDEMSFAFRATRQEWNSDYTERIIREVALDIDGSDVSIVTYPASKATVALLRNAAHDHGVRGIDELRGTSEKPMTIDDIRAIREMIRIRT